MLRPRSAVLSVCSGVLAASLVLSAAAPASAVVVERVVAIVGDRPILLSDLRVRARPFLVNIQKRVPAGAQQAAAESQVFKDLIEKMIEDELISQAAEKARLSVTADEIDEALKTSAAAQGTTVAVLYKEARAKGLTDQEFRDEIRRQVLEGKLLLLRVKGRVRITEEDVRSMFDRVVREERKRREMHPAWIVIHVPPGSPPAVRAQKLALAEQLATSARNGADFGALAKQHSADDTTRDLGGDLGVRAPSSSPAAQQGKKPTLAPAFEEILWQLEPGQVSKPAEVGQVIVVMKLLNRQPSRYTTLEASRNEMLQRLQIEILERAKKKWLEELRRKTHLDVRL